MSGYFLVILFFWLLIGSFVFFFKLQIVPRSKYLKYFYDVLAKYVMLGLLVDVIALHYEWYFFPSSTIYLWRTPFGFPMEELLFFFTVSLWLTVVWKLSQKIKLK